VVFNPNFAANSALLGSTKKVESGKVMVGMIRLPFVCLDDKLFGLFVFFDVNPIVWNLVLAQELFALSAVGAPVGTVYGDFWF
jgi:hypothetical protein